MKHLLSAIIIVLLTGHLASAQTIPQDSLYLGQTPPGSTPVIFNLPVTPGLRPVERIAISNDGTEIYFGELNIYPPSNLKINYFSYQNNTWQGPSFLFSGYLGPALSPNDSMMFMQEIVDNYFALTFYSVRTASGWSTPDTLFHFDQQSHYCQLTDLNNYYLSTVYPGSSTMDISRVITAGDTTLISLGPPICTAMNEGDFFIARDESFMIHARSTTSSPANLLISYKKSDGSWTNSKSMGDKINTNLWEYGPFVTIDKKYLFFTRGGSVMSSYNIYWVRVDSLIDSLQYTNYAPYVKYPIPDQTAYVGLNFNYTIPDSTFFDDDGYNTLSFRATLNNGSPLPQWLSFDSLTCTFTGTPASIANINIKVTATDTAGASVSASMKLVVQLPESVEKKIDEGIRIYPNPTAGMINISLDPAKYRSAKVEICDFQGRSLHSETFSLKTTIDWSDRPRGIYFLRLQSESISVCKKVILE